MSVIIEKFCNDITSYFILDSLDKNDSKFFIDVSDIVYKKTKDSEVKKSKDGETPNIFYRRASTVRLLKEPKNFGFFFDIYNLPFLNYLRYDIKGINSFFKDTSRVNKVISEIKMVTLYPDKLDVVLKDTIRDKNAVCLSPRWFFAYKNSDIKKLNKKYKPMNNKWMLLTDLPKPKPKGKEYDFNSRTVLSKSYIALRMKQVEDRSRIKLCIDKAKKGDVRFVYYEISLIIEKIPSMTILENDENFHRTAAVLDFGEYDKTKKAKVYVIETSINDKELESWKKLEDIINHSLIQDIEVNLGINCDLITYDMDNCPRINIQEKLETCALWSLFLFFVFIFYPNRRNIYIIFSKMNQLERNKVLGVFIYYYGTKFDKIINNREIITFEIIKISNYYKNLKF